MWHCDHYIIGHMTVTCISGDPVSLETQNGLLELLAYYGLGNTGRGGEKGVGAAVGEWGVEELGEELGKSGSEEAAAYLAREEGEKEERSLKDRPHLMQFHVRQSSSSSIFFTALFGFCFVFLSLSLSLFSTSEITHKDVEVQCVTIEISQCLHHT